MKKLIATIALVILTAACTPAQTETAPMQGGMMCEKCACCQKMMGDATMKDKLMNMNKKATGEQCMMGKGGKDGKKCCCQKMMEEGKMDKMDMPSSAPATKDEHSGHHPAK
jgi:hypothetical protein